MSTFPKTWKVLLADKELSVELSVSRQSVDISKDLEGAHNASGRISHAVYPGAMATKERSSEVLG